MKPSEVLLEVRELVAAKDCKRRLARDASGRPTSVGAPEAKAFCTVGAIARTAPFRYLYAECVIYLRAVSAEISVAAQHDQSTHLENVERIERAILLAQSEGR